MTKTVTTGKATDLITFTRSTTGTYLDSVKYGDELVTNGTFDTGTEGWTSSSSGAEIAVVDGELQLTNTAGSGKGASHAFQTEIGKTYKITTTARKVSGNSVYLVATIANNMFASNLGYDVTNSTTNTQLTVIFKAVGTTSYVYLRSDASGVSIFDNVSAVEITGNQGTSGEPLLRTADTNEPRIEYDADGNLKGLLIEEQRTNLLTYSEAFTPNWSTTRATISETNETAPDGTTGVKKIIPDTNNGNHYVYQPYSAGTHTWTLFAKAAEYGRISLWEGGVTAKYASFDLRSGTILSSNADSKSITPCGNGWYRCSITVTVASGTPYFLIAALNDTVTSHSQSFEGDDVSGTYIWGAQLETGSFPTSYIPTSGSTVTRNADVASISTSKFEYNENASCVLIEASFLGRDSGEYPRLLDFAQGVNTSSIWATSTAVNIDKSGVGAQATVLWDMSPSKIAASVTSGDIALVVNDSAVDTSTATLVTTSTQFTIGATEGGSDKMSGHIKSIKYYPVRLTDNQLKALTQ